MEQKTLGKWQLLAGIIAVIIGIFFTFSFSFEPETWVLFYTNPDALGILILGIAMILTGYYNLKAKRKR